MVLIWRPCISHICSMGFNFTRFERGYRMKVIHWGTVIAVIVGYVLGVKFPQWGGKVGL